MYNSSHKINIIEEKEQKKCKKESGGVWAGEENASH